LPTSGARRDGRRGRNPPQRRMRPPRGRSR
jgi:hypothetical protein